jgi:hypothetical protein
LAREELELANEMIVDRFPAIGKNNHNDKNEIKYEYKIEIGYMSKKTIIGT